MTEKQTLSAADVEDLAKRLRNFRGRNEHGDPVHYTSLDGIADEFASALRYLVAERDEWRSLSEHAHQVSLKAVGNHAEAEARAEKAEAERDGWMPRGTAPKDGTRILAGTTVIGRFTGKEFWEEHIIAYDDETDGIHPDYYQGWDWEAYTHWRPLPPPPQKGDA